MPCHFDNACNSNSTDPAQDVPVSISCVYRLLGDAIRNARNDREREAYMAFERQVHAVIARHNLRPQHRLPAWRLLEHLRAD